MSRPQGRHLVLAAVAVLVGCYYLWQARAANGPFAWRGDKNGFYNLLARGFLRGQLYVPVTPSPELLALPDPWSPAVPDSLRWQDMVLYRGRYYLYFGAAPAVLLFAPWRAVTGHDLPEPFAIAVICFAGFLFAAGAFMRVLDLAQARPGLPLLGFLFLALAVCQSAPFLLNRVAVYEIAIASGYCCVCGGLFFLARGVGPDGSRRALAASGAMFGLAVASRPPTFFAAAVALAALTIFDLRRKSRSFLAFAAALAVIGAGIAIYNYQRFGNPLEFGFRYQLAGPGQNRIDVAARNLVPGFYYTLLARPDFSSVFPWVRIVFRFPFDSAERHPLPPEYFIEPTAGALWIAPILLAAFWIRAGRAKHAGETRLVIGTAAGAGIAVLLFLVSTHLMTQRYEVDFLPLLVFAATVNLAMARGKAVAVIACVLIAYSATANLALAIAGPYDDYLRNRPTSYVRLASRLSPSVETRPIINPRIDVQLEARFTPRAYREPIVTIGRSHYCLFVYAEWIEGGIRIVSKTNDAEQHYDLPKPGERAVPIRLDYAPESGEARVSVDGRQVLTHRAGMLIAAPAQVAIGENYADMGLTARRFTGSLRVIAKKAAR
jgi:hypothetical protein